MIYDAFISDATNITELFDLNASTLRFNNIDEQDAKMLAEIARINGYLFVMIPAEDSEA